MAGPPTEESLAAWVHGVSLVFGETSRQRGHAALGLSCVISDFLISMDRAAHRAQ